MFPSRIFATPVVSVRGLFVMSVRLASPRLAVSHPVYARIECPSVASVRVRDVTRVAKSPVCFTLRKSRGS